MAALDAIVREPLIECLSFLFLPALQDFFPSPVVHIGWSDVPDSFVIPPLVVELDELRDGRAQFLRTGPHQQIHPDLQCFVEPFELAIRLRMVGRTANVPHLVHPQILLERSGDVRRPVVSDHSRTEFTRRQWVERFGRQVIVSNEYAARIITTRSGTTLHLFSVDQTIAKGGY